MPYEGDTARITRAAMELGRMDPPKEPQSIKDDLVQRLYGVDTSLTIINERLGYLADRIMGQDPETEAVAQPNTTAQIVPPMIHQLSDGITTLERQAAKIEQTINRFNGLV